MVTLLLLANQTGVSTEDISKLVQDLRYDLVQDIKYKVREMGVDDTLLIEGFADEIRRAIGED